MKPEAEDNRAIRNIVSIDLNYLRDDNTEKDVGGLYLGFTIIGLLSSMPLGIRDLLDIAPVDGHDGRAQCLPRRRATITQSRPRGRVKDLYPSFRLGVARTRCRALGVPGFFFAIHKIA
jgi:hypothetical protein